MEAEAKVPIRQPRQMWTKSCQVKAATSPNFTDGLHSPERLCRLLGTSPRSLWSGRASESPITLPDIWKVLRVGCEKVRMQGDRVCFARAMQVRIAQKGQGLGEVWFTGMGCWGYKMSISFQTLSYITMHTPPEGRAGGNDTA